MLCLINFIERLLPESVIKVVVGERLFFLILSSLCSRSFLSTPFVDISMSQQIVIYGH